MMPEEINMAHQLANCRFLPGSTPKRFAANMSAFASQHPDKPLSAKQARYMRILHHQFRRQIPQHQCTEFCRINELTGSL